MYKKVPLRALPGEVFNFDTRPDGTQIASIHTATKTLRALIWSYLKGGETMAQTSTLQFIHRLNEDGTIDSVCRNCFVTVATALSKTGLERGEREHRCDPLLLERYKNIRLP